MPCLAAVLSLVDVAQVDANVVGAPGVHEHCHVHLWTPKQLHHYLLQIIQDLATLSRW